MRIHYRKYLEGYIGWYNLGLGIGADTLLEIDLEPPQLGLWNNLLNLVG